MALSVTVLSAIAARKGNEYIQNQLNMKSKLKEMLEVEDVSGAVRVINVRAGGVFSASVVNGGDVWPAAFASGEDGYAPSRLVASPVDFAGRVKIPLDSAKLVNGKADSIKLVKDQFDLVAGQMAVQLGRSLISQKLAAVTTGSGAGSAQTLTVDDISGFRLYMQVDVQTAAQVAANSTSIQQKGIVAAITRAGDGTGTVTLASLQDVSGSSTTTAIATGCSIFVAGTQRLSASLRFVDIDTLSGSGDVYGTTVSGQGWSGFRDPDAAAALSLAKMAEVHSEVAFQSGDDPNMVLMSRQAYKDYATLSQGAGLRRFAPGDKLDALGKDHLAPEFRGDPIVIDDQCPINSVYFFHSDHVKLGRWEEISPVNGSGGVVSQTNVEYLIDLFGMYNVICDKRSGVGRLKITT